MNRYRSLMLLVAVVFAQLLLMAYQLRRSQDIPLLRGAVVYVVAPAQKSLVAAVRTVQGAWKGYFYLRGARQENQALNSEVDRLKMENQRLRSQAEQGRRLQVLFDLSQQLPLPTLAAQVLSAGPSETARIVMIDKGSRDGLRPDLPVMVPDGVVGKILHVFSGTAQVLLITDPYSGVASLLEGSRVHGILKGENHPACILAYVPNGEPVSAAQKVYTSGEDHIFPKGLPLGVVVEVRPGLEFQHIKVEPLARLNRLEEVLVILEPGGDIGSFPVASASPEEASSVGKSNDEQSAEAPSPPGPPGSSLQSQALPPPDSSLPAAPPSPQQASANPGLAAEAPPPPPETPLQAEELRARPLSSEPSAAESSRPSSVVQ